MKQLLEKLSDLFLGEQQAKLELRELHVQFIRKEKAILKQVKLCKESGGLIGVYSPVLGEGMFLTTVDEIHIQHDDTRIDFKPYDISGKFLDKTSLSIKDISCICPFNQIYSESFQQVEYSEYDMNYSSC